MHNGRNSANAMILFNFICHHQDLSFIPLARYSIGFANNEATDRGYRSVGWERLSAYQPWENGFYSGHNKFYPQRHQQQPHDTGDDVDAGLS